MSKPKTKKILIEYTQIDSVPYENNKMKIAKNAPKYNKHKEVYLYELFFHDCLKNKIKDMLCSNFASYQFYDSFLIELSHDEFDEIKYLFEQESELEKAMASDEMHRMLLFLNASVKMAQLDPKFWEA